MIEALLFVNIATRNLCVQNPHTDLIIKCYPVALNSYKTKPGAYKVDKIFLNADMLVPNGSILPSQSFGGVIIDFANTNVSVHSWKQTITPLMTSSGCVRMSEKDIREIINSYYFNVIIVQ